MSQPLPRWIFWLALATTVLTWLLIILGGVVHGTGSSLACPDWPTCYGSFFPEMVGGVFFEHSHRLVGAAVGLCTVLLWIALLFKGTPALKKWAGFAVILVIFQGVLGGITVIYRLPPAVSTAHLATSMLFLALMAYLTLQTLPRLGRGPTEAKLTRPLRAALLLVYLQIVLGGLVRHLGAGLACLDIPFCNGEFWPGEGLAQIQMAHRWGGLLVALVTVWIGIAGWRILPRERKIRVYFLLLPFLVLLQIGLGLWSVYSGLGLAAVSLHLGLGALLWVLLVLLNLNLIPSRKESLLGSTSPISGEVVGEAGIS